MIGTRGVGKTTLLVRYSDEHFEGETRGHHTLTKDLRVRDVDYSGWHIKLQIWDAQCRTQHYLPLLKNAKGLKFVSFVKIIHLLSKKHRIVVVFFCFGQRILIFG